MAHAFDGGLSLSPQQIASQVLRLGSAAVSQELLEMAAGTRSKFDFMGILSSVTSQFVDAGIGKFLKGDGKLIPDANPFASNTVKAFAGVGVNAAFAGKLEMAQLGGQLLGSNIALGITSLPSFQLFLGSLKAQQTHAVNNNKSSADNAHDSSHKPVRRVSHRNSDDNLPKIGIDPNDSSMMKKIEDMFGDTPGPDDYSSKERIGTSYSHGHGRPDPAVAHAGYRNANNRFSYFNLDNSLEKLAKLSDGIGKGSDLLDFTTGNLGLYRTSRFFKSSSEVGGYLSAAIDSLQEVSDIFNPNKSAADLRSDAWTLTEDFGLMAVGIFAPEIPLALSLGQLSYMGYMENLTSYQQYMVQLATQPAPTTFMEQFEAGVEAVRESQRFAPY